jgi:membrane associated rhomboid family serine protease
VAGVLHHRPRMFPLGDDNSLRHRTPVVVYALILVNVLVFLAELSLGDRFVMGWSAIPYEITHGTDLTGNDLVRGGSEAVVLRHAPGPAPIQITLLSSMFMHGGWLHLLGNMLYLWIFGDQIEDLLGHAKFSIFYLGCGIVAALAQILIDPDSRIPTLGASGAIAGVLGAYIVKFPRNRVRLLSYFGIVHVPALLALGVWIAIQVFGHVGVMAGQSSGVAYMAHIGGFVAGVLLIFVLAPRTRKFRRWAGRY